MSGIDTLSMALKNLYKRKLRTFLTVLGVVVGSCAIIIMISLGLAINQSFEERMMSTPNATVIQMWNYMAYSGQDRSVPVLDDDALAIISQIDGVETVTPWMDDLYQLRAASGRYIADFQVVGVYPEALESMGYTIAEGRNLSPEDEWGVIFGANVPMSFMTSRERSDYRSRWAWESDGQGEARVDVFNDRILVTVDYSYGEENTYGDTGEYTGEVLPGEDESSQITVKTHRIKPVGILAAGENWESTSNVFMDVETVNELLAERQRMERSEASRYGYTSRVEETFGYSNARVKATDVNAVDGIVQALQDMGYPDVYSPATDINNLKTIMGSLQTLLGAMGIISLFIATIGISNTMIMSTVERTREIGVMKVIGASLRDIRKLFLLESAIIGFFGGALGVGVSYIASFILNKYGLSFFEFIDVYSYYGEEAAVVQYSIIPAWLSLSSLGFAAVIGLFAGFFPAQRATAISALAAIRSE